MKNIEQCLQNKLRNFKMNRDSKLCFCLGEKQINVMTHGVSWIIWNNDGTYIYLRNYYWKNDVAPFKSTMVGM